MPNIARFEPYLFADRSINRELNGLEPLDSSIRVIAHSLFFSPIIPTIFSR